MALVSDNKLEDVLHLVDTGVDVNDAEPLTGWTPMIYAAYTGKSALAEFLILAGANVNQACRDGWTPLMFAARQGHSATVHTLLRHGADPLQSNSSITALAAAELSGNQGTVDLIREHIHHVLWSRMYVTEERGCASDILPAAHSGNIDALSLLLTGGHDVNEKSTGGWTPLILAAASGSGEAVELLLQSGADLNAQDHGGWTALMFASHDGTLHVAQRLMGAGADALITNSAGHTASDVAIMGGHAQLGEAIYLYGMCWEMRVGNLERIIQYAQRIGRANVQCEAVGGYTPLIVACKQQDEEAVRTLLALGADPSLAEADGWTPVMFTVARNNVAVLTILLTAGARLTDVTLQGMSVLDLAQRRGSVEVQGLLGRAEDLAVTGTAQRELPVSPLAESSLRAAETPCSMSSGNDFAIRDDGSSNNERLPMITFDVEREKELVPCSGAVRSIWNLFGLL